jgi:hypothetical protein
MFRICSRVERYGLYSGADDASVMTRDSAATKPMRRILVSRSAREKAESFGEMSPDHIAVEQRGLSAAFHHHYRQDVGDG